MNDSRPSLLVNLALAWIHDTITPFTRTIIPDYRIGFTTGLDLLCIHTDDFVGERLISSNRVFEELLFILVLFWLHAKRGRRR